MNVNQNHEAFIWSIAESLRGPFKPSEYGDVVLPFTILRRLDAVLEPTKDAVLAEYDKEKDSGIPLDYLIPQVSGHSFYNVSRFTLTSLIADPEGIRDNFANYLAGFSGNVRDIFERFELEGTLNKLDEKDRLYRVTQQFAATDLHPDRVSNIKMGQIFEGLIRRFNEASNETAGDHFTPREVIQLMVDLLFSPDEDLAIPNVIRSVYDPTAGTGGMLSVSEARLRSINPSIDLALYGQDYNDRSYAICKSDMLAKGQHVDNIKLGNTLTADQFPDKTFDYCFSNPPFGVDWKVEQKKVLEEHDRLGFAGRFGAGTPRVSDGALLFLLHLVSKMNDVEDGGSRVGIVLNGSPLFSGGAGSGESNIRKWLLDNDLLEAIVALPKDMFYNTGIATYVWILTNRKSEERAGAVQLIDGSTLFRKMRKGIGSKRNELGPEDIKTIVHLYEGYTESDENKSKVFKNQDFLYRTITVERPLRLNFCVNEERVTAVFEQKAVAKLSETEQEKLKEALDSFDDQIHKNRDSFATELTVACRSVGLKLAAPAKKAVLSALSEQDDTADLCVDRKGNPEPDPSLRDTENVPWTQDVDDYFQREVKPYVPEAWVDHSKTKDGAEIPFTRHFYTYTPPRSLDEIDSDLNAVMGRLRQMLVEVKK